MTSRSRNLVFCTILSLGCVLPAAAHLPEGVVFDAFRFPPGAHPVVDGLLSDWDLMGPPTAVTTDFTDLVAGASPMTDDFSARVWVGWSEETNRLYVAAEVVDDIHQVDRPAGSATSRIFLDDDMEVFIDADHSGGQFADFSDLSVEQQLAMNGTQANHFVMAGPHPDGDYFVGFSAAEWYALEDGPYTQAAISFSGTPGGAGVTRYELALTPFNRVNVSADFLSVQHDLETNGRIGFNLEFSDFDALSDLFDAKWSLSGGQNAFRLSERFTDLRLAPLESRFESTHVADRSWARIKASFGRW